MLILCIVAASLRYSPLAVKSFGKSHIVAGQDTSTCQHFNQAFQGFSGNFFSGNVAPRNSTAFFNIREKQTIWTTHPSVALLFEAGIPPGFGLAFAAFAWMSCGYAKACLDMLRIVLRANNSLP